jgi:hypothetical protein
LVEKINLGSILASYVYAIASFDFGCPKRTHIVFALFVIFLKDDWVPKHITIEYFLFKK